MYAAGGHIVICDLNIVRNIILRDLLSKGPKYRERVSNSWHQNFRITMDASQENASRVAKKEDVEVGTLSEWIKAIVDVLLKRRIRWLKSTQSAPDTSPFSATLILSENFPRLHENFVILPAYKASNKYTIVHKRHYVSFLIEELGLNSLTANPAYNITDFSASEMPENQKSVLPSFGIETSDDELDLPYIIISDCKDVQKSI